MYPVAGVHPSYSFSQSQRRLQLLHWNSIGLAVLVAHHVIARQIPFKVLSVIHRSKGRISAGSSLNFQDAEISNRFSETRIVPTEDRHIGTKNRSDGKGKENKANQNESHPRQFMMIDIIIKKLHHPPFISQRKIDRPNRHVL